MKKFQLIGKIQQHLNILRMKMNFEKTYYHDKNEK